MVYLTSSRITPSRFVSFAPRVLIEFRAFWLRATVSVSNLGHLSGCGPCWPCGTLLPDVGARNEFNLTALRNWLRSHSSGKFLIVCPAPSREFARFRHRGWSPLSSSRLTTSIYVRDTTGVSRMFRVVSRIRVPLAR